MLTAIQTRHPIVVVLLYVEVALLAGLAGMAVAALFPRFAGASAVRSLCAVARFISQPVRRSMAGMQRDFGFDFAPGITVVLLEYLRILLGRLL